jgi:hypothetical protein
MSNCIIINNIIFIIIIIITSSFITVMCESMVVVALAPSTPRLKKPSRKLHLVHLIPKRFFPRRSVFAANNIVPVHKVKSAKSKPYLDFRS